MFSNLRKFLIAIIFLLKIITGANNNATERLRKSKEMLKYMNLNVKPCDDFYAFACGNYDKYYKVDRIKKPIIGSLDILNLQMESQMKTVLESKDDIFTTKSDRKVKSFYRSCLRASKLKSVYKMKLKELIREIGVMPLLDIENGSLATFDWMELIAKIASLSALGIIVQIEIDTDYLDNTINRVYLSEVLNKPKSFYATNLRSHHEKYINDISEDLHLFLDVKLDMAFIAAKEIFKFEAALAQGMNDERSEIPMTEIFPAMTIRDLQLKYSKLWNVRKFFNLTLGNYTPALIYVQQNYLDVVFKTVLNTPKYIVANYIFYSYIKQFFYARKESPQGLRKKCLRKTKHFFYKNLDNMIYRRLFTPQMKEVIFFIWHEIKSTFADTLHSPRLNWVQEKTRNYALQKLKTLDLNIATYENVNFERELQDLQLKDHDYIYNIKSILKLRSSEMRAKLKQNLTIQNNPGEIASFTPMYMAAGHFVSVPVAYLQPNFAWSSSLPNAYNFAQLGFSMAHELMHAFDDGGRYYDAKGVYNNWWDTQSSHSLEHRIQCFIDQYKRYSIQGYPLPEMKIQSENISDNGGIRLAFAAYRKWYLKATQNMQDKEYFSNFNFTTNQCFFISFAQLWCSVTHRDYLLTQLTSDTHVPERFRVIGPLSNLEEFSQEFNCPLDSYMNPVKKCEVY